MVLNRTQRLKEMYGQWGSKVARGEFRTVSETCGYRGRKRYLEKVVWQFGKRGRKCLSVQKGVDLALGEVSRISKHSGRESRKGRTAIKACPGVFRWGEWPPSWWEWPARGSIEWLKKKTEQVVERKQIAVWQELRACVKRNGAKVTGLGWKERKAEESSCW